jgi:hypothetical protein
LVGSLPEDWVRIQVYMPEEVRWRLRMALDSKSDSKRVLKVILAFLSLDESQRDSLMDGI